MQKCKAFEEKYAASRIPYADYVHSTTHFYRSAACDGGCQNACIEDARGKSMAGF